MKTKKQQKNKNHKSILFGGCDCVKERVSKKKVKNILIFISLQ